MATPTRPTTDQVRFHSSKTGTHILDKYIEDIEQGSRTLADMIGELFDTSGDLSAFEFRLNNNAIEYKIGTGPWVQIQDYSSFFNAIQQAKTDAQNSASNAQNWATYTSGPVSGLDYSAKYWATEGNTATVATNIGAITTVAGISADVTTLANINADVTAVAQVSSEVAAVAPVASEVPSAANAANDLSNIHEAMLQMATNFTDSSVRYVNKFAFEG